jgi:tRNA1(Val) A37 N6-methylase TrmN6
LPRRRLYVLKNHRKAGQANLYGEMVGFFDSYSRFFETSSVGNWPARLNARHEAIVAANASLFPGARVLDLASHDGRWSLAALKAGAAQVVGVEVRPELVAAAQQNLAACGVSPERYRFESGDVFEREELFRERFDLVLCLGFFYHTTRHVELLRRIRSTKAKNLILDTNLLPQAGAFCALRSENIASFANGMDTQSVRGDTILVATPTPGAVNLMLGHFGYSAKRYNWKALIGRLGLQPQADQNLSAQNPLVDYHRDSRGTFLATQAETSD